MRNILFFVVMLVMASCGSNTGKKQSDNEDKETKVEQKQKKSAQGSCDEFLADYEKWVDEFVKLYKEAKANPTDMEVTQKMVDATNKMAEWSEKWTKLYDCANNEKYVKRMEELQKRVEKEMNEQ